MSELGRPALTFLRSKARSLRPMFYSTADQSTSLKNRCALLWPSPKPTGSLCLPRAQLTITTGS